MFSNLCGETIKFQSIQDHMVWIAEFLPVYYFQKWSCQGEGRWWWGWGEVGGVVGHIGVGIILSAFACV